MTEGETAAPTAAPADAPPNHTVYAKNLNDKVKAERMKASLYAAFSAHGKVLEVVMSGARRLRGQAWVTFDDVASASAALRALNGALVFDKPLVLQFGRDKADVIARRDGSFVPREKRKREAAASTVKQEPSTAKRPSHEGAGAPPPPPPPPKQAAAPNKILFLQDLPESCNQEMLGVLFKQYHGFKEVRLVPGKKGLAFVEFGDEAQAAIARQGLSGFKLTATDTLQVSFAKK